MNRISGAASILPPCAPPGQALDQLRLSSLLGGDNSGMKWDRGVGVQPTTHRYSDVEFNKKNVFQADVFYIRYERLPIVDKHGAKGSAGSGCGGHLRQHRSP
jgi:hypothetical protein